MVAGYLKAFRENLPLRDAFVSGVAAASASVMTEGTRLIDAAAYRELLSRVRPERL
jgi:fructose-1-phosphate kinase PfkB-like protein